MLNDAEMKRLRWRCTHRAQLEMDVLLGHFLNKHFATWSPEQQAAFASLAEMEDVALWPLVIGKRECADPVQAQLLAMMRNIRADGEAALAPPGH
jgi:succinate dehydrogenase flavin-adding protein (antitoxin of CptAB toxin-antitoxin module)